MVSNTATSMFFMTEVRNRSQASGTLTQPSVSTQISCSRAATGADRLDRAEADGTGHRQDDVGALVEQLLGGLAALGLVLEVTGEEAVLGGGVPADELDVGAVLLVVVVDAGGKPSMKIVTVGMLMPP